MAPQQISESKSEPVTTEPSAHELLGRINYLDDWLVAHKNLLGYSYDGVLAEVRKERFRLYQTPDLQDFYNQTTREIALTKAALERITAWGEAADISPTGFQRVRECLESEIAQLLFKLHTITSPECALSEIEILDHAIPQIKSWVDGFMFTTRDAQVLSDYLKSQRDEELVSLARQIALLQSLLNLLPVWMKDEHVPVNFGLQLVKHLASLKESFSTNMAGRLPEVLTLSELSVLEYAIQTLPAWAKSLNYAMDSPEVIQTRDFLESQRQALVSHELEPAVKPQPPIPPGPMPEKPKDETSTETRPLKLPPPPESTRPSRPPIDWGSLWEKVVQAAVSGALLRGLLYLGAFMIVVSLTILVVRFWDIFPSLVQAGFIFSVPIVFYLAGWLVRSKLKLPQAGNALSGIGALLVAVDFAAIYQFGNLSVDINLYWVIAGLFCTTIYTVTAWRLKGVFFDYIALLGATSVLVALTRLVGLGIGWNIVAVSAASLLMVASAPGFLSAGEDWQDSAAAARFLPQVLLPLTLAAVIFIPDVSGFAQTAAFLLATTSYGMLAWRFPAQVLAHACVACSIGVLGLGLNALELPYAWFGAAATLAAIPYSLVSRWMDNRLPPDFPYRIQYHFAPELAGFLLAILAAILGVITLFFNLWEGIAALTLLALLLVGWSILYRQPILLGVAGGVFCVPYSLAVMWLLKDSGISPWFDWMPAAWSVLGLLYLGTAMLLRKFKAYAASLHVWVQLLPILTALSLVQPGIARGGWNYIPVLAGLTGILLIYLLSAWIHDLGTHPGLSDTVHKLPGALGESVFFWLLALLVPVWVSAAWLGRQVESQWLGVALTGLGILYLPSGQLLSRRKAPYRTPFHVTALLLGIAGVFLAFGNLTALTVTLYLDVLILIGIAMIYHRVEAIAIAAVLLAFPFQFTLELLNILNHAHSLGFALLACFLYIPVGILLDRVARKYSLPVFIVGYALSLYALGSSSLGRLGFYPIDVPWVGVAVPVIITGLYLFSLIWFRLAVFAWAGALTLVLAYGQLLTLLRIPLEFDAIAWALLAISYLLIGRSILHSRAGWLQLLRLPLGITAAGLGIAAFALTAPATIRAFFSDPAAAAQPAVIIAQGLVLLLVVLVAVLYRTRWSLFLEPWFAFFPVTMFFIGYAPVIFNAQITTQGFGIVWGCLAASHLLIAAMLDAKPVRYSHGLYLGGYLMALVSVFWTLSPTYVLVWTLGLWIVICAASAVYFHLGRFRTWDKIIHSIFGDDPSTIRNVVENIFLWLAAWLFPIWSVILLRQFTATIHFQWVGLSAAALLYQGLIFVLRKIRQAYSWPFNWAAQTTTIFALATSVPLTFWALWGEIRVLDENETVIAVITVQTCAVIFYVLSAAVYHRRIFAHIASWLIFFPYTLAWIASSPLDGTEIAIPWMGLATILLGIAYGLDRKTVRYAHGPYLAGYLLALFALTWSISDRQTNVIVLFWCILLAVVSQILIHIKRHATWEDLLQRLFSSQPENSIIVRTGRSIFLFFSVYAFPVWLMLLLSLSNVQLAYRGLGLALIAPLYLVAGLILRKVRAEYTWSFFSATYLLTAIGAMISFEDLKVATWVLALDAAVYAASAYIFVQPFWLYLSNLLIPVIILLILNQADRLFAPWVSGIFMGLAYIYFGLGYWFNRAMDPGEGNERRVSPFALPFYAPAYLLSAVSLAVASGEIYLAIPVYLAGVVLYAFSAWIFKESLFLYPAAWLFAVPYYLILTLLPIQPQWLGLGWLPLILGTILMGKMVFHRKPLERLGASWLAHPAMPFYILAYVLSISMVVLSRGDPLVLTLACSAAALIYLGSTALFQRALWLYPGLLAIHLALLAFFTINPSGESPRHAISLPFMVLTWIIAMVGYGFSRLGASLAHPGNWVLKAGKFKFDFTGSPSLQHLLIPSWAQPFFVIALLDILLWQTIALFGYETTIIVAIGFGLLLGIFTTLWQDAVLGYVSILFALLAAGAQLVWVSAHFAEILAWFAGIGFGLFLLSLLVEWVSHLRQGMSDFLDVWVKPLLQIAMLIAVVTLIAVLPFLASHTLMAAVVIAFAGAMYLAIAYRGRYYLLGYLAVGMLVLSWVLVLLTREAREPQLYAIPVGLYFTLIGYLETRRGNLLFAHILEGLGLAILMLTAFIQSLDGEKGFYYFVLLLVEGILVIWWGAARRQKIPFFAGIAATVVNVIAQVIVLVRVYDVNRWFVILGVGLFLVGMAVFIERRRERLIQQSREWRDALETWN